MHLDVDTDAITFADEYMVVQSRTGKEIWLKVQKYCTFDLTESKLLFSERLAEAKKFLK